MISGLKGRWSTWPMRARSGGFPWANRGPIVAAGGPPWADLTMLADSWKAEESAGLQGFLGSPLADSNRRPPPYHGEDLGSTTGFAESHPGSQIPGNVQFLRRNCRWLSLTASERNVPSWYPGRRALRAYGAPTRPTKTQDLRPSTRVRAVRKRFQDGVRLAAQPLTKRPAHLGTSSPLAASVVIEQDEWLVGRRYPSNHSLEARPLSPASPKRRPGVDVLPPAGQMRVILGT